MEAEEIHSEKNSCNGIGDSGSNSMDNSASCLNDNLVPLGQSLADSSSFSDVASISSVSSSLYGPRETTSSRMRFELRHGKHLQDNGGLDYLTPLQRRDRELKSLKRERSQMLKEKEERDTEIARLTASMDEMKMHMENEKDKEMSEYREKIKICEREKFEHMEELVKVQDELSKLDIKYIELKKEMSAKEETYEYHLQRMFKKGKSAAKFEREEELEMLASSNKAPVTVRELTRKLSKTELELAKWQGLRLQESYSNSGQPDTQAEATLSFLKDAFFHFLTDRSGGEDHLRAMITIFKYSEIQMAKIRKSLEDFKRLDRKRLSLK